MKVLTYEEVRWVSGGLDSNEIVVIGEPEPDDPNPPPTDPWWDDPQPYDPGDPSPSDPGGDGGGSGGVASGPTDIDLEGRECPVERAAAKDAFDKLYNGSATAKALMDKMEDAGVEVVLIKASLSGFGPQNEYADGKIYWDTFLGVSGTNSNGSAYVESPIMLLAHEIAHAGHAGEPGFAGVASEPAVMAIANKIAAEMNATYGTHYDTSRDAHNGTRFNTDKVTSQTPSIVRAGCP